MKAKRAIYTILLILGHRVLGQEQGVVHALDADGYGGGHAGQHLLHSVKRHLHGVARDAAAAGARLLDGRDLSGEGVLADGGDGDGGRLPQLHGQDDLAAEFHYNESYLSRMFQEQAGRSFSETVKDFKLRKAAELLKTRKWKLDHICEEIGYKDTRQFIRSFKEMYGITPDKFRKRVQIES